LYSSGAGGQGRARRSTNPQYQQCWSCGSCRQASHCRAAAAAAAAAAVGQGAQPLALSQAHETQRPAARELPSGNPPMAKQTQGQSQGQGYREGHLTADSAPTDESMYDALTRVVQPRLDFTVTKQTTTKSLNIVQYTIPAVGSADASRRRAGGRGLLMWLLVSGALPMRMKPLGSGYSTRTECDLSD
jgi:hypothetical protein